MHQEMNYFMICYIDNEVYTNDYRSIIYHHLLYVYIISVCIPM